MYCKEAGCFCRYVSSETGECVYPGRCVMEECEDAEDY